MTSLRQLRKEQPSFLLWYEQVKKKERHRKNQNSILIADKKLVSKTVFLICLRAHIESDHSFMETGINRYGFLWLVMNSIGTLATAKSHPASLSPARIAVSAFLRLFIEHHLGNAIIRSKLEDVL